MMITSATVEIGNQCVHNVFSAIENRLLDILILLENEFGILDELDVDLTKKSDYEKEKIIKQIQVIWGCCFNDENL